MAFRINGERTVESLRILIVAHLVLPNSKVVQAFPTTRGFITVDLYAFPIDDDDEDS